MVQGEQGDTWLRQGLPLRVKVKPKDQSHSPERAGLAQLLTSRQRQLLRIWLPDPRPSCCCVKEGGGPRAESHHTSSPTSSCVAFSGPL